MRTSTVTVPLARDSNGPIDVPDEANHWRPRRHTGGRPRLVLGVDKQPLRLPLTMTAADLEDILGPGTYRLDLCEQAGNSLNVTVRIAIGEHADPDDEDEDRDAEDVYAAAPLAPLPSTNNEMRLVLEANIRAMSASFQHNERTLAVGMRMAETLRDGVRVLADAQAEWIKSLTGAKGYLRNAAIAPPMALPPAPMPPSNDHDDDDGDDESDDDDDDRPPFWADSLAQTASQVVPPLVVYFTRRNAAPAASPSNGAGSGTPPAAQSSAGGVMDFLRDTLDLRRAAAKGKAKRAKDANPPAPSDATSPANANEPPSHAALTFMEVMQRAPQDVVDRLVPLVTALSPDDRNRLRRLFELLREPDIAPICDQIRRVPDDKLAEYLLSIAEAIEEDMQAAAASAPIPAAQE